MTVLLTLRIPVSAEQLESTARDNQDLIKGIAGRAQERGAIHHGFYEDGDSVVVVDEWDNPESFQSFFEAEGQNIGELMQKAGATGQPGEPKFHRKLNSGDEF